MKILEGQTVGIDLGTTYSAIAQLDPNGVPLSLPNADGKPITPSVVLLGEDGKVIVGPTFERMSLEDPSHIVEAIKRQMGNKDFFVVYQNKKLTPEFISALILKKLKQDAEKTIGPITNAVITVPYYFNDIRRKATQDAGRIAGLNVIDIINEPTAATLAYAWQRGELGRQDLANKERTILVYDLGGGTFDVTVVRYTPTSFRVLATDGDVMLGGLDWSRRIVDHIAEQFHRKYSEDPREDPESMMTITQECEDAKRELSTKAQVSISCYYKGKTLTVALSRGDFERITSDLMQRTKDTTELVMEQAGMKKGQLDEVVLVGGSTYMPVVEAMLKEVSGRAPSRAVVPEEAVAQGACIHAAILEARATGGDSRLARAVINRLRSVNTTDVNSHSLGVKISDPNNRGRKINHIMIPKNSPVPHRVTQQFVTNSPNQQRVHICVLEGDAADPDACTTIGDFRVVNLPPNLPAGSPVEVTYEYDKNGRIGAYAKELTGHKDAQIEIQRSQGLDMDGVSAFENLAHQYHVEQSRKCGGGPPQAQGSRMRVPPSAIIGTRMDVYKDWLGIPDGPRPPDHYELLRCVRFTDEPDRIRANYKKLNAHVRKYATGQFSERSQTLLNELAKAMLCLTDPERKRDYDEGLGREFEATRDEFGRLPLLDLLVKQQKISRDQKKEVEEYAKRTGLSERDAVVQLKLVGPEHAAQALAQQLGYSYVELEDMLPEDAILDAVPKSLVKSHTFLPLFIDDDRLLVAGVNQLDHEVEEELQLRYGVAVRPVITTPRAINQAIAKYYAAGARNEAAEIVPDKKKAAGKKGNGKTAEKSKKAAKPGPKVPFDKLPPDEQVQRKQIGYIVLCWSVIIPMLPQLLAFMGVVRLPGFLAGTGGLFLCIFFALITGGLAGYWVTQKYWK